MIARALASLRRSLAPKWRVAPYRGNERILPGVAYRRYRRALREREIHRKQEAASVEDPHRRLTWRIINERASGQDQGR